MRRTDRAEEVVGRGGGKEAGISTEREAEKGTCLEFMAHSMSISSSLRLYSQLLS